MVEQLVEFAAHAVDAYQRISTLSFGKEEGRPDPEAAPVAAVWLLLALNARTSFALRFIRFLGRETMASFAWNIRDLHCAGRFRASRSAKQTRPSGGATSI
jgi:hypothetical protein